MGMQEIKARLYELMEEYSKKIEGADIFTKIAIRYEDANFEDCDPHAKDVRYIIGEITFTAEGIPDDEGLCLFCELEIKGGRLKDEAAADGEIAAFKEAADRFLAELLSAESRVDFLKEYIKKSDEEAEARMAAFEADMDKMKRNSMIISAVAVAAFIIVGIVSLIIK